jgi:hypothetical protein
MNRLTLLSCITRWRHIVLRKQRCLPDFLPCKDSLNIDTTKELVFIESTLGSELDFRT